MNLRRVALPTLAAIGMGGATAAQEASESQLVLPRVDAILAEHTQADFGAGIAVVVAASDGSSYVRTAGYLDD